jgi:hypothetical protein
MAHRVRKFFITALLVTVSGCAGLFLAELIVRLFLPQSLILRRPDVWYPDAGLGWKRAANINTMVNFGGAGPVRLITDNEGNRIGANGKVQNPELRILALGDSFLEALQVEYEQTMTWLLQEAMTQQTGKRTEVVCGRRWMGAKSIPAAIPSQAAGVKFDLQLVFFYLENDIEKAKSLSIRLGIPRLIITCVAKTVAFTEIIEAFYPINDWLEIRSQAFIYFAIPRSRFWRVWD